VNIPMDGAAASASLRVRVNRERCQGHARCVALVPNGAQNDYRALADEPKPAELGNIPFA
jgi:hypothetical protein